jgi:hypothetical protein
VILRLRIFFLVVLVSLLAMCVYASLDRALWNLPREIVGDPWFLATLLDACWGFIVIWLWIAYREDRPWVRGAWLLAVLLLGNMAVALYLLRQLACLRPEDGVEKLLLRPDRGGTA